MALTDENHLNSPIALSTGQKTHTPTTDHHPPIVAPAGPTAFTISSGTVLTAASLEVSSPLLLPIFDVRHGCRFWCCIRPEVVQRTSRVSLAP